VAYPPNPLDYEVEMYLAGGWRDATADVLGDPGITLRRGRSDQSSTPNAGSCTFTLRNDSGAYSPRWPTGPWYGSIGRNTPVRVSLRTASDTFTRTVSSGWGSADTGQAWSTTGAGGSVLASDFAVGSGVGTHSVSARSAYRVTYLPTVTHACVDVRADVSLPFSDVTGSDLEPCNILLRGSSVTNYHMARVVVTSAEAITVKLMHYDGTVYGGPVTISGLTHSSSQVLRVRAQAEGSTLRVKVWAASGNEPYGWHLTAHTELLPAAGWVGIRNGVSGSNTNTLPIVFSIDNVRIRVPLFAGEIADLAPGWDTSGEFVTSSVTISGPLRRLAQSTALQSTLRRGYLRDLTYPPIAYWPCEDAAGSTLFFAPAIGDQPLWVVSGAPSFAALSPLDSSGPLPAVNLSAWFAQIPPYTPGANRCQVRFVTSMPAGGLGVGLRRLVVIAFAGGSIGNLSVYADGITGDVWLYVYNNTDGSYIYASGGIAAGLNGAARQIGVEFQQTNATTVNVNLISLEPGAGAVVQISSSGADMPLTQTIGVATSIAVDPDTVLPSTVSIGHISFHTSAASLLGLASQLNAWKGEAAANRLIRLGGEEGLPVAYGGDPTTSEPMGPQLSLELLKLLYECSGADLGELFEARGELGPVYRTRASLCNQTARITLDYSAGQTSPPFQPVDDDRYLTNDVTVSRNGGSSARAALSTGRLGTASPDQGGSGRYATQETVNVYQDSQLNDLAGWLLHLGTTDEARYPTITLDLANIHLTAAGLQAAVLDLDIGDRVVVQNPKSGQTVGDISQIVIGLEVVARRYTLTVRLICVPESPYQVGVLDDTAKRLDSDRSTLSADITTTAVSFTVAIAAGSALWTTAAGDMPIAITIGGEVMSVGAISGTSSPQTFSSVTRSVNGVVVAHAAGSEVHVTYPFVLS